MSTLHMLGEEFLCGEQVHVSEMHVVGDSGSNKSQLHRWFGPLDDHC
jgi:hypothetical protein